MACVPQDLMDGAKCFVCLQPWQLQLCRVRLLCAIKDGETVSCDPLVLLEQANCLNCLTPGQLNAVEAWLLCQIMSAGAGAGGVVLDSASITTTDATVTTLYSFVPRDNATLRFYAEVEAFNSTSGSTYGRLAGFKTVGGIPVQIGATATLLVVEEDVSYDAIVDISGNLIRVRVTGAVGRTINWKVNTRAIYSP